jgi:hypothetical protein
VHLLSAISAAGGKYEERFLGNNEAAILSRFEFVEELGV